MMRTRSRVFLLPAILTGLYVAFYLGVLIRNVYWSDGDQTDVIRTGIAAFPIGLLLSFAYPGGRTGAFVAVSMAAAGNALLIFWISWLLCRKFQR